MSDIDKRYDRVIDLIKHYIQLFWLVFSAFLLTETVLLGALAALAKDGPNAFVIGCSALGLMLVLPWWASFEYNHALYYLRIKEALRLEEENPALGGLFKEGGDLIHKGEVKIHGVTMPWISSKLRPRRCLELMVILFGFAFFLSLVWSVSAAQDVPSKSKAEQKSAVVP